MKKKKPHNTKSKTPPYLDRKIRKQGGSRIITFSQYIPEDWTHVRIRKVYSDEEQLSLSFVKLRGKTNDTHTNKPHPQHKQNP